MKNSFCSLIFLIISGLIFSCEQSPTVPVDGFDIQNLIQGWTRSYEEETNADTVQLFRPLDFKSFPASRFRMQYIFKENGDCEWLYLHPADAHYMKTGRWKVAPHRAQLIQIFDGEDKLVDSVSFRVVELKKDLLRIIPGAR